MKYRGMFLWASDHDIFISQSSCNLAIYAFQFVCAKSLQSCLTLCDLMDCRPLGSSVHGILQATVLVLVAAPCSRGSSQPTDRTCVSYISSIGRKVLHRYCCLGSLMFQFKGTLFNICCWFINIELLDNSIITHAWKKLAWLMFSTWGTWQPPCTKGI